MNVKIPEIKEPIVKGNDIRRAFLDFYKLNGHEEVASSSLVPHNDPTLLFTNAGMNQFKDVFLELEERPYKRATTAQKCVRAGGKHNDLDTVGKTARHHTFFEMMGNFSFGDYFKEGAITLAWTFLTEVLKLDKSKLYITVYNDDEEAVEIWKRVAGVGDERIYHLGEKDNFWSMGDTGPCGPCSEIHYDRGEEHSCGPDCGIGKCDCDRWLEIWNLVFMQYNRDENGVMTPLPHPCIDTGMGLERVASVLQDVPSNYDTDLLHELIDFISRETGLTYYTDERGFAMRVVADHARSCTFLIADGVLPSNDGRGYVLRRILRRACRFIKLMGIDGVFLAKVVPVVVEMMGHQYPEIQEKKDFIIKVVANEEERFHTTLAEGMNILEGMIAETLAEGNKVFSGDNAFKLYDTYGFPIDLTEDACEEKGISVDKEGFEKAMEEQRERARAARGAQGFNEQEIIYNSLLEDVTDATVFTGYSCLEQEVEVLAVISGEERKSLLNAGEEGLMVLNRTPFYAEMGGQVGDCGIFTTAGTKVEIFNTKKLPSGIYLHSVRVTEGTLNQGDTGIAAVKADLRADICRNHTATHLMHKALKEVLGDHVNQAGSLVTGEHLRFDFNHFSAVTPDELRQVEDIVNGHILENMAVVTKEMDIDAAKAEGAMALFGEKYGKIVRFVNVGGWSKELCGGTHVKNIGEIGLFKIVSESSIGAGLRRIEAVTGRAALDFYRKEEAELKEIRNLLKIKGDSIEKIQGIIDELKEKDRLIAEFKKAQAAGNALSILKSAKEFKNGRAIIGDMGNVDMNGLRETADKIREEDPALAMILFGTGGGKVSIVAAAGDQWQKNGFHAGKLIKEIAGICGGGGGGKPGMAQAGAKDASKINEAMALAEKLLDM